MLQTTKLGLFKPEINDDILDTITKLSQNFDILDEKYNESISNLETFLTIGNTYEEGKKFWNANPVNGGFVGWVNTRTGVYAPKWKHEESYNIGDLVIPTIDNGHVYECVVNGTSGGQEPVFPTNTNGTVLDISGHTVWSPSKVYDVGDIVIPTNSDTSYYYKCVTAGTSNNVEPSWLRTEGLTIVDGSVVWYVYKTVEWKEVGSSCLFTTFGEIKTYNSIGKFAQDIGDGTSTTITVNHNLGTQDVTVMVRENNAPYSVVNPIIEITDDNNITLTFASVPSPNQFRVIVTG
jgi:hypothetical protein